MPKSITNLLLALLLSAMQFEKSVSITWHQNRLQLVERKH